MTGSGLLETTSPKLCASTVKIEALALAGGFGRAPVLKNARLFAERVEMLRCPSATVLRNARLFEERVEGLRCPSRKPWLTWVVAGEAEVKDRTTECLTVCKLSNARLDIFIGNRFLKIREKEVLFLTCSPTLLLTSTLSYSLQLSPTLSPNPPSHCPSALVSALLDLIL